MRNVVFWRGSEGFTLVEMIVVVFLLALAMLGILAVFDASARINKSETDVADAQGNVRFGLDQMTRVIRMAGAGGLHTRQAILNKGAGLAGINPTTVDYDNVAGGTTIQDLSSNNHVVRPGTDMIEVRGVILSPLYGLLGNSCGGCQGAGDVLQVEQTTGNALLGVHYNDDATNRPQFAQTISYTVTADATNPMLVLVASTQDQSAGCSAPPATPLYPLPIYNVALMTKNASLSAGKLKLENLNFASAIATRFNGPDPTAAQAATNLTSLSRGGVLDDIVYFIDNGVAGANADHPTLAQATRRGDKFDVVGIANDVEDMQIAYGIDTNGNGVDPVVSETAGGDEWSPNVAGEAAPVSTAFVAAGTTCPNLHGVMVSLLSKSRDPDPTYKAPAAAGYRLMNVPPAAPAIPLTMAQPGNYRRRVQTVRITLRNYSYEEP